MPNPETRQRVLSTATAIFLAEGYDATNLDDVAQRAGVSKKTIYKHIGSKAQLFLAAVHNVLAHAPTGDLIAGLNVGEPRAALRTILLKAGALALSEGGLRFYAMLARQAATFPELPAALDRLTADFVASLNLWLDEQKRAGWLRADIPASTADLLLHLLVAQTRREFILGRRAAPDEAERERLVDTILDIFLRGTLRNPLADQA